MFRKIKFLIISILIITSLNSCVVTTLLIGTAIVAGGAVYYINGNYIIEVSKNIRTIFNATIKTIQTNNSYSLGTQKYSENKANITATIRSEKISITLTNKDNKSTEIKIRVGTLGNEKISANLANQITKNIT